MTEETNSRPRLVFAVDLGGTHLRVALVDDAGKIHAQLKQESPKGERPDCVVTALVAAAEKCGCKDQFAGSVIAASIVVPGAVDVNNAVVVQAPNLPALNNFGLKAALEEKFSWPVILENDANAAAVGEMWMGAARGFRDVISVTLGTGVGGGIILDGKLWRGAHGSAGEIGHMIVSADGPACGCGKRGCLERYVSLRAAYESLDLPDPDHGSPEMLEELLERGDGRMEAWIASAVAPLRQAIDVLELALDPETVVLGGFMPLLVIEAIARRLEPLHLSVSAASERTVPRVMVGAAGKDTSVLGAAALPIFSETNPQFDVLQKPLAGVQANP
jgi:predicted NBD/HSP70 family sugar kinase